MINKEGRRKKINHKGTCYSEKLKSGRQRSYAYKGQSDDLRAVFIRVQHLKADQPHRLVVPQVESL